MEYSNRQTLGLREPTASVLRCISASATRHLSFPSGPPAGSADWVSILKVQNILIVTSSIGIVQEYSLGGGSQKVMAIRREDQSVWERRSPLAPHHVRKLVRTGVKVIVQPSNRRAYPTQVLHAIEICSLRMLGSTIAHVRGDFCYNFSHDFRRLIKRKARSFRRTSQRPQSFSASNRCQWTNLCRERRFASFRTPSRLNPTTWTCSTLVWKRTSGQ
jgi:hypothetical protein